MGKRKIPFDDKGNPLPRYGKYTVTVEKTGDREVTYTRRPYIELTQGDLTYQALIGDQIKTIQSNYTQGRLGELVGFYQQLEQRDPGNKNDLEEILSRRNLTHLRSGEIAKELEKQQATQQAAQEQLQGEQKTQNIWRKWWPFN